MGGKGELQLERRQMVDTELVTGIRGMVIIILVRLNGDSGV